MHIPVATIGLASTVAVACTPPVLDTTGGGRPAVHQVELAQLRDDVTHPDATPLQGPAAQADPSDAASAAVDAILTRLHGRGRTVTDVGSHLENRTDDRTTVRVLVTHTGTGDAAADQTSIHLVDLIRGSDGRWTVADDRLVR